ncbi:MAG: sulfite exporter TauE/SafE family protein [Candidatus Thermoplasmatota archaeon]|jgi:hypothetical protein
MTAEPAASTADASRISLVVPRPAWAWSLTALLAAGLFALARGSDQGLAWHARAAGIGFAGGFAGGMVAGAIGLIAIPLLVFGLGLPIHQAAATNLVQTAATAGFGAWRHWRMRLLDLRNASFVLGGSLVGAPLGSWTSLQMPADRLSLLFVAALVAAAAGMAWRAYRPKVRNDRQTHLARNPGWKGLVLGVGLGFASGLLGVGAGFLVAPSLAAVLGLPLHLAVGTGLAVIAGNSVLASIPHFAAGQVQWLAAGFMAFGGAFGVRLGATLGRRTNERVLRTGMAVVLAAAAYSLLP